MFKEIKRATTWWEYKRGNQVEGETAAEDPVQEETMTAESGEEKVDVEVKENPLISNVEHVIKSEQDEKLEQKSKSPVDNTATTSMSTTNIDQKEWASRESRSSS